MSKYNFVFCIDKNYAAYLFVLIFSIIKNITKECHFWVVYSSINSEDKEKLEKIVNVSERRHSIDFIQVNPKELIEQNNIHNLRAFRGGYDAFTRLFLPEILKVQRCIYLDTDMVVINSLDELMDLYDSNEYVSGVLDTVCLTSNSPWVHDHYVNSGMLLLHLENLKNYSFTEKSVEMMINNFESLSNNDQDVVSNVVEKSKIRLLDRKFNQYLPKSEEIKNSVILHFTGSYKPWNPDTRWRQKKVYWYYYFLLTKYFLKHNKLLSDRKSRLLFSLLSFFRPVLNIKPTLMNSFKKRFDDLKRILGNR